MRNELFLGRLHDHLRFGTSTPMRTQTSVIAETDSTGMLSHSILLPTLVLRIAWTFAPLNFSLQRSA